MWKMLTSFDAWDHCSFLSVPVFPHVSLSDIYSAVTLDINCRLAVDECECRMKCNVTDSETGVHPLCNTL